MQRILGVLKKIPFQHVKVVRFLLAGGTAAALNFTVLWSFTEVLHLWYMLSLIFAIITSSIINFTLQKFWTFENHSLERVHMQVPQFVTLGFMYLILNSALLYVLVEYAHLWYLAGQVLCVGVLAIMNFFIYQHYIFSNRG